MQSGLYFGYLSMIEGLVRRVKEGLGPGTHVVATGGLAPVFADDYPDFEAVDPNLTLEGLRLIYSRNR